MDKEFYNLAVKLMDNIRQLEPNLVSARDAELCVLMTESQQIYAGITGVKISAGQLMRACPEYNAIMAMVPEGESRVLKLITVSFAHREVSQPCEGCLELLCRVNAENRDTEIFVAANRAVRASVLMPELAEVQEAVSVPAMQAETETDAAEAEVIAEETVIQQQEEPAAEEAVLQQEEPAAEETALQQEEPAAEEAAQQEAEAASAEEEAEEAPAEEEKPKDEFAQFGFEEAESDDYVTHVEAEPDNPFYEPPLDPAAAAAAADVPKFMRDPRATEPRYMYDQPQSGYLEQPMQQSGYVQSGYLNNQSPQGGSMYASQPLPGQQQAGPQFRSNSQPFQPGAQYQQQPGQPFQPGAQYQQQGQPFQPGAQYQQQGQPFQPGAQYQQQGQPYQQQSQMYQQSQPFQPNPQYQQSQQYQQQSQMYQQSQPFQPNPQYQQSQPFQPNPQYQQSQQYQGHSQYASQPLPGSNYINSQNGTMTASQPLPGANLQPQTPVQKEVGSAFKERLNAFVDDGATGSKDNKPLTKAEMLRQAKEKKKMAKIDAEFKKQMRKKGL